MTTGDATLGEVADRVTPDRDGDAQITLKEVVKALGPRSHYALLMVVAAAAATPLSGIPGVSALCGVMIALVALERIFRPGEVYVPDRLGRRSIDAARVRRVIDKARPVIDWVDAHTRPRWTGLFRAPLIYLPLVICALSGILMPFLELIPFTSSIVATGVLLISVALVTRDGLFAVLAVLPYLGIAYLLTRLG